MQKPLTIARRDYMQGIVNLTNNSNLPAFVIVNVLEDIISQVRPLMDSELARDEAQYRAALQKESKENQPEQTEQG